MGTDGDVYPFLGLGAELLRRGHRVTVMLSDLYRPLAEQHGFEFAFLAPAEETERLLANPDFWHPLKAARVISQWGLPYIGQQYELLTRLCAAGDTTIVASAAILSARLVQENSARRWPRSCCSPACSPAISPRRSCPPISRCRAGRRRP
jgi:rhamnosyltransferase subunit B